MSMIGNLTRIPEEVRIELHKNPTGITSILYPDFAPVPDTKKGFLSRLFGKKTPALEEAKQDAMYAPAVTDTTDIDKAWHALHYLFTGSSWEGDFPQGFLVSCGESVGDVDVGYGPAKSFNPAQVKAISEFLSALDKNEIKSRFDPKSMSEMKIYPDFWKRREKPDDVWKYIENGLDEVTRFVQATADMGMALLVFIN